MAIKQKLAVATALCCFIMLFSCCGRLSRLNENPLSAEPTKYINEFKDHKRYAELDRDLQRCYGTVYTMLTDEFSQDNTVTLSGLSDNPMTTIGVEVTLPLTLDSREKAQTVFNAIIYDNPHFFYLNSRYGLEGYEKDGDTYYTSMIFTYIMDASTRQSAKQQLDAAVEEIIANAPNTTDDYLLESYVHDQLIARCTYDDTAAASGFDSYPNAYSAYGAIVEGKAVCEGYSRAIQLLLGKCGISSAVALGRSVSTGEQHMWNIVTINGNPYHLDATWNDSDDILRHNYFNLTTDQIRLSHQLDNDSITNTPCTATTDNYFYRNGLYIHSYSRKTIAAAIAGRIKAGDTQIELLFDADKYDNALLFLKNSTAAGEQINPLLASSGLQLWPYRLYGDDTEHILMICKK